jgi:dTDP-4-amino-4,6-dideoxygalactose transaminase
MQLVRETTRVIPFARPMLGEEERAAVRTVMEGTTLVHGPKIEEFEQAFAAYTGAPEAVAVSSCTAAMHLAYLYLGLGPGDEVIVPAQTHVATAHAVEITGAKPVFAEADPATGNIDIKKLAGLVNDRTRALAVVHFMGLPVDMKPVVAFAREYNLFVVEDCALALGSSVDGVHAGLLGDVGCFSFYPVKHITTAEGGMLITRDPAGRPHSPLTGVRRRPHAGGADNARRV